MSTNRIKKKLDLLQELKNLPQRLNNAANQRIQEVHHQLVGGPTTDATRPLGTKAVLNGKPVRWGGQNWGWQSTASYSQLEKAGEFRRGEQKLRAIGNDISNTAGEVWSRVPAPAKGAVKTAGRIAKEELWDGQPQVVKDVVKGTLKAAGDINEAVSEKTNISRQITGELLAAGTASAVSKAAKGGRIAAALSRLDDVPTPVTRQGAGAGVSNRIRRRLDAAQHSTDAGSVSLGRPGDLSPSTNHGGRRVAGVRQPEVPQARKPKADVPFTEAEVRAAREQQEKLKKAAIKQRNKQLQQIADDDPYLSTYGTKEKRLSQSSVPGRQPKSVPKPENDWFLDLDRDALLSPEAKGERIRNHMRERAIQRAGGGWDEQMSLQNQLDHIERPVSPIRRGRPRNADGSLKDFSNTEVPKSQRPLKGAPPTRREQRAFDALNEQYTPRPLTASERKRLTALNKEIADNPRNYEAAWERESLIARRDGRLSSDQVRNPRWQPGTVQGGTKKQALQNMVDDLEDAENRLRLSTPTRPTKGSPARMGPGDKLKTQAGDTWSPSRGEVINGKDTWVAPNNQQQRSRAQRIKRRLDQRTKQYEDAYKELLPNDVERARKRLSEYREHANAATIKAQREAGLTPKAAYTADEIANPSTEDVKKQMYWLRQADYKERFGKADEARFTQGMRPKTDNPAGKESVKRQFKDARNRRGVMDANAAIKARAEGKPVEVTMTGDTRFRRGKPTAQDRIGRRLRGAATQADKDVQRLEGAMRGRAAMPVNGIKPGGPKRSGPKRSAGILPTGTNQTGRTVPVGRTVLDQMGNPQPKPRQGGRIRARLNDRGYQSQTELRKQRRQAEWVQQQINRRLKKRR